MNTHTLKVSSVTFAEIFTGLRNYLLGKPSCDMQTGDHIILQECYHDGQTLTGQTMQKKITHFLRDVPQYGLQPGFCIVSLEPEKQSATALRSIRQMGMDELVDFIHVGQPDVDAPYHEFEEVLNEIREKGINAFDFSDTPPQIVFKQIQFLQGKGFDLFENS